ncbi:MAG: flagellar synthesis regulator FleN [Deltaproteobacteria bacterium RIFOXYD12_FULL_55_16]|nr:MAG: flagellar synthesis regulator FleN [Deltaproteobacteria bacterium RIFOXYD12_FULL_55_16]
MTHSQSQGKSKSAPRNRAEVQPRVICVTSGKGGVGKTNVVTNLGYALARAGKKTLILDADLNLANVDILLGLTPRYNLHHVFLGEKTLAEVLVQGPAGLLILPASSGIMELAELTEQQRLYFLAEMSALAQEIEIMLIDTAAGINSNVIYFNLAARERIVVLTPEPTSLTDAYALIKVLSTRHDVKRFRILINLARSEKEALAVFRKLSIVADRFLDSLSLDYLGYIPYDSKLPTAVREQRLVSDIFPDAPSSKMFNKLAENIFQEDPEMKADGNIKFFWQGLVDL